MDAAREILAEAGWEGLGIRAVAARAGVSSGAVYQWFSGKEEIFGELYQERIATGFPTIEAIPHDADLRTTVDILMRWTIEVWEALGRYELEFVEVSTGRAEQTFGPAMNDAAIRLGAAADAALERAAQFDGTPLIDGPHRMTWFWGACVGVTERLLAVQEYRPADVREEFIEFSVDALTASLVATPRS